MAMTLSLSSPKECFLCSTFVPSAPWKLQSSDGKFKAWQKPLTISFSVSCSSIKIVRSPCLDKHVIKQNKIRFVQKLKTLLLSKPKHYLPIHILAKCRSYLAVDKPISIMSMIHRYPAIFELFRIPTPDTPINATRSGFQLCVRLTPAAASLAMEEMNLRSEMSLALAAKLQKLVMLSSHHRLLLTKLVHLAPDLGLPPNFRSRLCNDYPEKFKIVDTSYGRALELVTWDPSLANPLPYPQKQLDFIVDRPLKFKRLSLRKGLNLKRRHYDYLVKFRDSPDICPYETSTESLTKDSIEAEKRACGVVREILGMTVEKRTLVDHLTHFRKEFELPNKLRDMIVRHPELFYVSLKGLRDSVLLVEAFDDKGMLLEKDPTLLTKYKLLGLVNEGRKMRRKQRKEFNGVENNCARENDSDENGDDPASDFEGDYDDGFENLFDSDVGFEYRFDDDDDGDERLKIYDHGEIAEFWTANASALNSKVEERNVESW